MPTKAKTRKQPAFIRGVTRQVYYRIRYRVERGELTWAEAVALGLCSDGRQGRPRKPIEVQTKPAKRGSVASAKPKLAKRSRVSK